MTYAEASGTNGAACKGTGYPGAFPGGLTTGFISMGAAIPSAGGAASGEYAAPFLIG